MRLWPRLAFGALLLCGGAGCTVGEGYGEVKTSTDPVTKKEEKLYVAECWNGPFDLQPDFFAANPYRGESLMIRVQRGDNNEEASDGLLVIVNDLATVRNSMMNQPIEVGLPSGVAPPGQPVTGKPNPIVSLSLYLHQSCHEQNSATYSVGGTITFAKIFSGDPNEKNSDDRRTDAEFDVTMADPRDLVDGADPAPVTGHITGNFHFFFQRGQPAQPFQ